MIAFYLTVIKLQSNRNIFLIAWEDMQRNILRDYFLTSHKVNTELDCMQIHVALGLKRECGTFSNGNKIHPLEPLESVYLFYLINPLQNQGEKRAVCVSQCVMCWAVSHNQ